MSVMPLLSTIGGSGLLPTAFAACHRRFCVVLTGTLRKKEPFAMVFKTAIQNCKWSVVSFSRSLCFNSGGHRQSNDRDQCPYCSKIFSASSRFSWIACALGVKPLSSVIEGSALFSSSIRSVSQAVLRPIDGHAAKERAVRPFRFLTSRSAFR